MDVFGLAKLPELPVFFFPRLAINLPLDCRQHCHFQHYRVHLSRFALISTFIISPESSSFTAIFFCKSTYLSLNFWTTFRFELIVDFRLGTVLQFGRRSTFRRSDVFQISTYLLRFFHFSARQKSICIREFFLKEETIFQVFICQLGDSGFYFPRGVNIFY